MNELGLQKLVVDVVNESGGFARKMNNRFLIGVSDLLVKLPGVKNPAGFLEVKQRAYPRTNAPFDPGVTHLQSNFLRAASQANMPAGIMSFLQTGNGSGLKLWLQVQTSRRSASGTMLWFPTSHVELGRAQERGPRILSALHNWIKEWKEEQ